MNRHCVNIAKVEHWCQHRKCYRRFWKAFTKV